MNLSTVYHVDESGEACLSKADAVESVELTQRLTVMGTTETDAPKSIVWVSVVAVGTVADVLSAIETYLGDELA